MLTSGAVTLRGIERADIPELHAWGQEHETWPEVNLEPYGPSTVEDALRTYDAGGKSPYRSDEKYAGFAIEAEGKLVGSVGLWGIDLHNRRAHLGISLGAEHRGMGYGTDACKAILTYAFVERGLHRVQLEVLASNLPARKAYEKAGFTEEGVTRQSGWVRGEFVDEVWMAVLAPHR